MAERQKIDLLTQLSHNLERLEEYERLLVHQEKLIEGDQFERLIRVLDKKAEVLSQIAILRNGTGRNAAGPESSKAQKGGESTDKLLALFTTKIRELVDREKTSLKKAMIDRAELAEQLQVIYHGKKLLRRYKPGPSDGKARFKDIKT